MIKTRLLCTEHWLNGGEQGREMHVLGGIYLVHTTQ